MKKVRTCASTLRVALALTVMVFVGVAGRVSAQQKQHSGQQVQDRGQLDQKAGNGKVDLLHVQGNVYMIAGAGANITVQVGDRFVIVVDTGIPQMSEQVLAAIRGVTSKPILFIIDTSADEDHTGGNENLSKAGWALPNSAPGPLNPNRDAFLNLVPPPGASIMAHINALNRMSERVGKEPATPQGLWPTDTYETGYWRLYNSEGVFMYHPPHAHTDGDTYVLFRKSDVVSTGDILNLASYPVIKADRGSSINGLIDALNQIIQLLEPEENEEGGTYVIPGHGRICDRNDVVNYRDMVTIIRDRVEALISEGMTLDQVKAAKPTIDYDGLYGATTGPWTTDMFVEAVYQDLGKNKNQQEHKVGGGR